MWHKEQSWSAAELFLLNLLALAGVILLIAAPAKAPASKSIPTTPRKTPVQPSPANRVKVTLATVAVQPAAVNRIQLPLSNMGSAC